MVVFLFYFLSLFIIFLSDSLLFGPSFTGPEPVTLTGYNHQGYPKLISGMEICHPHCVPLGWQADMMIQAIPRIVHLVVFFQRETSLLLEAESDR